MVDWNNKGIHIFIIGMWIIASVLHTISYGYMAGAVIFLATFSLGIRTLQVYGLMEERSESK